MNPKAIGSSDARDARYPMGTAGFFLHQQQLQPPPPQPHPQPHPQSSGLARLPSVYSLTFDEFQTAVGGLGKDFGSMNMDDLIRSIWSAEETQSMAATPMPLPAADATGTGMPLQRQGSLTLPRTLSQKTVDEVWRDLFNETGAAGIDADAAATSSALQWPSGASLQVNQRQPTLGEMTLEEFLVRAGVVREDAPQQPVASQANIINASSSGVTAAAGVGPAVFYASALADLQSNKNINSTVALGFGLNHQQMNNESAVPLSHLNVAAAAAASTSAATMAPNTVAVGLKQTYSPPLHPANDNAGFRNPTQGISTGGMGGIAANSMVNTAIQPGTVGLGTTGVTVATITTASPLKAALIPDVCPKSSGEVSTISPTPYAFNMGLTKKRTGVEKVIERRQRRMIKNRESAARSRARKQAYTLELEAEVAKLKELNQVLQNKQAEMMELQKTQVTEIINKQQSSKRLCLRRAQTGPW